MPLRRFSFVPVLFLLLWGLWFLLPWTRHTALVQWKLKLGLDTRVGIKGNSRDAQFARAMDTWGEPQPRMVVSRGAARAQALAALGRQFPNDAAICAAQLLDMSGDLAHYKPHQLGPSSAANVNWSVWLSQGQAIPPEKLKAWMAAAERGAKLDPNNTFWDWMRIIGLQWAGRDREIWPVLKAARSKTGYEDYAFEGALAHLRLQQQQGTVSPIGQISIWAAVLLPHYAVMRQAARDASDAAAGLRLRGQKTQALEGMHDLALLSRTMRRESKLYIGSLVGSAMEFIALYGGSYSATRPSSVRRPTYGSPAYAKDSRSLQYLALQLQRPDIAKQIGAQWSEMALWRTKTGSVMNGGMLNGVKDRDLWCSQLGEWMTMLLVAGIPGLLVLAVVCSLALRIVPTWRRERDEQPTAASWIWGVGLGIVGLLVLISPLAWTMVGAWRSGSTSSFDILFGNASSGRTGLDLVPPSWQSYFLPVICLVCGLWLAVAWSARREGRPTLGTRLRRVLAAPDDEMTRFDLSPLLMLTLLIALSFVATFGVLAYLILPTTSQSYAGLHDSAGLILFCFAAVMVVPSLLRLRTGAGRAFALILTRRFAWGQLLLLSLLWGLLLIAVTPAQKRFDADFARQLSVGEMQLARKQVGL